MHMLDFFGSLIVCGERCLIYLFIYLFIHLFCFFDSCHLCEISQGTEEFVF